jgi:hypothetical protein
VDEKSPLMEDSQPPYLAVEMGRLHHRQLPG